MIYLLLPLAVALFLTCDADADKPTIERVFFQDHSYISFNNKDFIHDPDCRCCDRWIMFSPDDSNEWIIYKLPINAYD